MQIIVLARHGRKNHENNKAWQTGMHTHAVLSSSRLWRWRWRRIGGSGRGSVGRRRRKWCSVEDFSKWIFAQIIARRIILADLQQTSIETLDAAAAQEEAVMPHDLRVVAAHLVGRAIVGVGVVVFLLHGP